MKKEKQIEESQGSCDHMVGAIKNKPVPLSRWEEELLKFTGEVHHFNTAGQRIQIPHPGWAEEFKYCPECGHSLAQVSKMTYEEAFLQTEPEQWKKALSRP